MSKVDTHPDQEMLRHYKLRGFPSFLLIDSDGNKVDDFHPSSREALKSAGEFATMKMSGAADSKDLNVRAKFLMLSLMKEPSEEGAKKLAETMKSDEVSDELKKEYTAWMPKYEMTSFQGGFMSEYRKVARDQEAVAELEKKYGKKAIALWKKGAGPDSSDMQGIIIFSKLLMEGSVAEKNKKSGEAAMALMNKHFGSNERAASMLKELQDKLDSIE